MPLTSAEAPSAPTRAKRTIVLGEDDFVKFISRFLVWINLAIKSNMGEANLQ